MSKKRWPKCADFRVSEDPNFCANCGNIASAHKGPTLGAPRSFRVAGTVKPQRPEQLVNELAEAFLRCPLPDSVCADGCATKQGPGRIGTNLLSYVEARQMMQEVVIMTLTKRAIQA